jgi:hypothetical protein
MFTTFLAIGGGTLGGGLAGGAITWWCRRSLARASNGTTVTVDPAVDECIDQAAAQWATAHGQPAAAPLVANKLRLAQRLATQRSGRWSA